MYGRTARARQQCIPWRVKKDKYSPEQRRSCLSASSLIGLQVKHGVWKKKINKFYLGDAFEEIPASMPARRRRLHLVERFRDLCWNFENVVRSLGQVKRLCGGSLLSPHDSACGMKVGLQIKSFFTFYKVILHAAILPPDWISPGILLIL